MIRLRPESTAYASPDNTVAASAGEAITKENTVLDMNNASAVVDSLKTPRATVGDSIKATFQESIAAKAIRGVEYAAMPTEAGFDVTKSLGEAAVQYSGHELEFLSDARSAAELKQRQNQVQADRENYGAMGQNLTATIAASILDVDLVIGMGIGQLTKVSRAARLVIGLSANSAVLGVASNGGRITPLDVVGTSVGVALGAIPQVRRAVTAIDDAAETAEGAAARTARYVDDPDYVPPRVDTVTMKPHIEVGRVAGAAGDVIQTDIKNAVRAVVSLGDDLTPGQRALGVALADSLDLDSAIPVVFRQSKGRSNTTLDLSGNGGVRTDIVGSNAVADNLSSHIKNMTAHEKGILLHEAAHAKTGQTIMAVRNGTLTSGPQYDAVKRIGEIRQYVSDTTKARGLIGSSTDTYNIRYGLKSDDEFIAQVFNSDAFRKHLQSIKMPGSEGSVWTELVRKVVQAFTGNTPSGTTFDNLVKEFDNLLAQPQVASQRVTLNAPAATPVLQSPILSGARNAADLGRRVQTSVNNNFALYERLASFGPKANELAGKLVVDATGTSANSAAHYARTNHLATNLAIAQVDDAMAQVLKSEWSLPQRLRHPVRYKEAQREFSEKVYNHLADSHTRFRAGQEVLVSADSRVQGVVDAFVKSRWAEDSLERLKAAGVQGADDVASSPYYLPRQHSGDKMSAYLRNNRDVTRDDVIGMYTSQFKRMFAHAGIEDATAKKLGTQMVRNMEQRAAHTQGYRQSVAGMSYDDIQDALVNAGIEDSKIAQFMGEVKIAGTDANRIRNLRGRAEFNMTEEYATMSGKSISPQMFVNTDTMALMEGYSRRMSGRVGLARAGFPDIKDMVRTIDEAAAEATNPAQATTAFDNTINQLLGYPTGEAVPDILRSLSIVGSSVNLANSGIYQLADVGLMLHQFGVTKTFKALSSTSFGRSAFDIAKSPEYGSRLRDVIEARNVMSGKYRSILTHLEDNHDIGSLGVAHQYIQQLGQGTRFANGMEFVRRGQSKMVAGLIADTVDDAIKGNAAAVTALKRFGLTDDLLDSVRSATAKNPDLREWPSAVRLDMETMAHNMADNLVLENRLGELPAWMQFSAVGKVVLPYMTFVAGAWNKILRRTGKLDGTTGIAMAFAYQLPLATVAAAASLTLGGQDVTPEKIMTRAITQVPLMSWLGFGVDFAVRGPTNSIAALSIIDKMYTATSTAAKGEFNPESLIKAVPFLGIVPGMRLLGASLSDDD